MKRVEEPTGLGAGDAGFLTSEEVDHAELVTAGIAQVLADEDAATTEGVEAAGAVLARTREAEAEEAAQGEVVQGGRFGGLAVPAGNEEEERRLGGEVGRGEREGGAVCAAAGAEGEEILEARKPPRDVEDQLRREVGGGGGGRSRSRAARHFARGQTLAGCR
jgi:hypothetical protein